MNRFLLAFALAFGLAAGASAQSVSTVDQTGDQNDARVDQVGGSTATVNQTEAGLNAANTNAPIPSPLNPGNLVILDQDASTASVTQGAEAGQGFSNAAQMNQTDGGQATITQNGVYNWVTGDVTTTGNVRPGDNNRFNQSNSTLNVDQDGTSNTVDGSQSASSARSTASATQDGRFNTATFMQRGMGGNTATVNQIGDSSPPVQDNGVLIADRQRAEITQEGAGGHSATVNQTSGLTTVAPGLNQGSNVADIDQDGSMQTATVDQTGFDNFADVNQDGTLNEAIVDQDGESNTSTINQTGETSIATADQMGTNSVSTITQGADTTPWWNNGALNQAGTLQIGTGTAVNTATITQNGGNLRAAGSEAGTFLNAVTGGQFAQYLTPVAPGITQVGEGNTSTVAQTGTWNGAAAVAVGSFNQTEVTQSGSSNFAGAAVLGNSNHVAITQSNSAGQAFDITNLAAVGVAGTGNEVTVDQSGLFGVAVFGAQGNGTLPGGPYDANGGMTNTDVSITQTGVDNQVVGYAIGDRNAITVNQSGTGNRAGSVDVAGMTIDAGIEVTGDLNTVSLTQSNTGNVASVVVNGDSNTATVTQQ